MRVDVSFGCCRALLLGALVLLPTRPLPGQNSSAFQEEVGYLGVRHDNASWPTPESLVAELRSSDDAVRLKALYLIGLSEKQSHHPVWAQSPTNKTIGEKIVVPDQIRLMYAPLGYDTTQHAVIAVYDSGGQMTYAAIGVPTPKGWERIAAFDCWCKYEMYSGRDALSEFVQLRPAPQHIPTMPERYELVLRASGGGTGIYTQNEAHYRLFNGGLRQVLSFVSDHRSCDPTANKCKVEKRWFYPTATDTNVGGTLVESQGRYTLARSATVETSVRALENRHLGTATCRFYKWVEHTSQYNPSSTTEPCGKMSP